ncbi:MAG: hypothetical protein QG657_4308 [Acidobacteriota bacterium]|nr:hypothetical protein [Acidobacteriota bacterium]
MPTYDYQCNKCGLRFERRQAMTEAPLAQCPGCGGEVHRLISGGAGFIIKGAGPHQTGRNKEGCSFEASGTTCCGRSQRCDTPSCGDNK